MIRFRLSFLLMLVVAAVLAVPGIASSQDPLLCDGQQATIVGTDGPDVLLGTPGDDVIVGLAGNDRIFGDDGDDLICAGTGRDMVKAGRGNDTVFGEKQNDRLFGQGGSDVLVGGNGRDIITGGRGADQVDGKAGNDKLLDGQKGFDSVDGGLGTDRCKTDADDTYSRCERGDLFTVSLQILAINDFHGNIATTSGSFGGTGRADFLAANIAAAEAEATNSIMVSAGDLIGASPLISALFHDEPTIEAMNLLGLDINGVGNHEFDEGTAELLRMANGGTHPVDGNLDGDGFAGADFEFLAANVVDDQSGDTLFEPYTIRNFGAPPNQVDVAFIGMTLEGTPSIVTPAGVAGLTFNDEAATVNALIPELQGMGVEAIVVLLHEGGSSDGGQNDCGTGLTGPIAEIVPQFDDAVDLVIAGHTNDEFICEIDGKWVTMADNRGRIFTDIDVSLDPNTMDMSIVAINNVANLQEGVTPVPAVTALIDKYDGLSAPLASAVIGSISGDILRAANDAGESALGDVIADAQLAATAPAGFGDAVVAFMNPGGIRDDMTFAQISGGEAAGEVTFGEGFSVQPFGNSLVTMTLTGAQIDTLLEQQWVGQENPRILQVSEGFTYTWDDAAQDGSRVDASTIMIDGSMVVAGNDYRVTVNSFLADGGDNFFVLQDGTNRLGGEVDLDALITFMGDNTPPGVSPGPQDRITRLN